MLDSELINATYYNTEDLTDLWQRVLRRVGVETILSRVEGPRRSWRERGDNRWSGEPVIVVPERLVIAYSASKRSLPPGSLLLPSMLGWTCRYDREVVLRVRRVNALFPPEHELEHLASVSQERMAFLPDVSIKSLTMAMLHTAYRSGSYWDSGNKKHVNKHQEMASAPLFDGVTIAVDRTAEPGSGARAKAARQRLIVAHSKTELVIAEERLRMAQNAVECHERRRNRAVEKAKLLDPTVPVPMQELTHRDGRRTD